METNSQIFIQPSNVIIQPLKFVRPHGKMVRFMLQKIKMSSNFVVENRLIIESKRKNKKKGADKFKKRVSLYKTDQLMLIREY